MYYRKKTKRATGAARGFKSTGMGSRREYVASLRAVPAAYTATRNRAPRGTAYVKGAIAPYGGRKELKYIDTNLGKACDTTGSVTALNLIAVGDDNTTRDGREVVIKSVQMKGFLTRVDDTVGVAQYCRVMLVWDNAVNSGSIATIAQILTSSTGTAFPLIDNAARFTILSDQTLVLGTYNDTGSYSTVETPGSQKIDLYLKINQVTKYSGTTAAIGSIQNGALLLVCVSTNAASSGAVVNGQVRVRFTDP